MRLLLTHGFFLCEDEKERGIMRPYPPLGLLYLCAYLRERGFDADIYDSTFGSKADLLRLIESEPPAWLGVYGNLLTRRNVVEIATHAHACGWRVILGGPEPAQYAEEYLAAGAEYVVPGEGETVLAALLSGDPAPPGVIYRDPTGAIIATAPAPLIRDLDSLPWPARSAIDIRKYLAAWRALHGKGSVSLITARGCPFECRWCSHSTYGRSHRRRSVTSVADEVEWIIEHYQPEMVWYADDVFTIRPDWTIAYAAEMRRRGLRVPFECITRADRLDARTADALAALGCFRVWIGSESGSQRILDAMRRGVRLEQVRNAVDLVRARGIETGMFLMWGYDGEEIDDIEATVDHVKACRPDTYLTTVSYPIKGTGYYDDVSTRLVRLGEWSQSTDRDVRIRGRHSRRFYQFADDFLRASMELPDNPLRVSAARAALETTFGEAEA
jgi:radical SAM superfamily enzyme YgiQ (UPF0313 family)